MTFIDLTSLRRSCSRRKLCPASVCIRYATSCPSIMTIIVLPARARLPPPEKAGYAPARPDRTAHLRAGRCARRGRVCAASLRSAFFKTFVMARRSRLVHTHCH